MAKKLEKNSLNALFCSNKENSIFFCNNKDFVRKMTSFFFGGRISDNIEISEENSEEKFSAKKVVEKILGLEVNLPSIFQINPSPIKTFFIIFSSYFKADDYGTIIKKLIKHGFIILDLRMISKNFLEYLTKNKFDFSEKIQEFLSKNELKNFVFSNKESNQNLVMLIEGFEFPLTSLIKKLCEKIIKHNRIMDPKKKEIVYFSNDLTFYHCLNDNYFHFKQNFTLCNLTKHFICIWPLSIILILNKLIH